MTPPTYALTTIRDLLLVPAHRREACVRDILYALVLQELAFGDESRDTMRGTVTWTDDGSHSATLRAEDGSETITLNVKPNCICHQCIKDHDIRDAGGHLPLSSVQMILCPTCGNKRCPHASDHRNDCTGSNEPGQLGSRF